MFLSRLKVLFVSLLFFSNGFCQDETRSKIKIIDFYLFSGMHFYPVGSSNISDFQKLAPESILLKEDMTGYNSFNGRYVNGNSIYSVLLGIRFKENKAPLLRLGLNYTASNNLQNFLFKEEIFPYDTLTSSQTGEQYYLDSTTWKSYSMYHSSEQIRLDASLVYRTNAEARWSLFTGIGTMIGFAFNSVANISYHESYTTGGYQTSSYSTNNYVSETHSTKNYLSTSLYIPLGIDFRIGKNREFWKRIHLLYEIRPTMNFAFVPELKPLVNVSLIQNVGLKFSI